MELPMMSLFYLALQEGPKGLELPALDFAYLGTRGIVGIVMLIHMIFAQLFVGYVIGSPLLQAWGVRKGNAHMQRLSHALDRFNVLTFSIGATFAGMFLVLIVGLYPRVTAALGAAFFILVWQAILTGVDTFMVTGGGAGEQTFQSGGNLTFSGLGAALGSIINPMFIPLDLHRTFGNLSWPAFAVAAWAAFRYRRAKSAEDRAFYDWAGSMGVMWGTIFLLLQPFAGFAIAYTMKAAYQPNAPMVQGTGGPYDRLVGSGADSWTSNLLYINLVLVVGLFMLSNLAMYLGAERHPEQAGRVPIRFFGLVAVVAGLYSISPIAAWPFLYMRYIMILLMVLATLGATVAYVRGRRLFRYGSPRGGYRAVLMLIGVLAVALTMDMGYMKSNSRVPYTIYGQPQYRVDSERPITQQQIDLQTRP